MSKLTLRAVESIEYVGASRYTGYVARSIKFTLSCGHETVRKASYGVPKRMHCERCEASKRSAGK